MKDSGINSVQMEDPQSKQQAVGCPAASSFLQHGPLGAQHHPTACSGELSPCWELSPGRSLPVPWDRQELGPWEKQGAQSPLNFDYRNKTWRRMLEERLQLPGLGEKAPALFPQTLQAWFRYLCSSSCQGMSSPAQHSPSSGGRVQPRRLC